MSVSATALEEKNAGNMAVREPASEASLTVIDEDTRIKSLPWNKRLAGIVWDTFDKDPEERALLTKLDGFILSYVCIAYFVKYLDQTNVTNAYVSGMKEDMNLKGNDLNYLTTYFTIGYIIGQFPSQLAMTKIRPSIWLPACEIAWSICTIAVSGAKNKETIFALRFLIGLFEASAWGGIVTLLGNWYTPSELAKRSAIFIASSAAAQMFSGYLQAALYTSLKGKGGLAAWKWLFVVDGIIGIPVSCYGFFAVPDSPTTCRNKWMKPAQKELAIERMRRIGRKPPAKLTLQVWKDIFTAWPVYLFVLLEVGHINGLQVYRYFNLWLKSTGKFTVAEINVIPTAGYGGQILFALIFAWVSDAIRMRWPVIMAAATIAIIGTIILCAWPADNIPAMMTGWILTFLETGVNGVTTAWINEVCGFSVEHRLIIFGVVQTIGFQFNAWVPLLAFDTSEAPHFKVGYFIAMMWFCIEFFTAALIAYAIKENWYKGDRNISYDNHPVLDGIESEVGSSSDREKSKTVDLK